MLDPQGRTEVLAVLERLRESGHGLLLITQDLSEALRADRVVVLSGGSVVFEDTVAELFERSADIGRWGLELPHLVVLASELRRLGVAVPRNPADADELVEALCR